MELTAVNGRLLVGEGAGKKVSGEEGSGFVLRYLWPACVVAKGRYLNTKPDPISQAYAAEAKAMETAGKRNRQRVNCAVEASK